MSLNEDNETSINLPKHWVQRVSKTRNGKTYYFNTRTKSSVWNLKDIYKADSNKESFSIGGIKKSPLKRNIAERRLKNLRDFLTHSNKLKESNLMDIATVKKETKSSEPPDVSNTEDTEPMEWEDSSDSTITFDKNSNIPIYNFETMEQYLSYKELLKNEQDLTKKYFYIIIDTNIFLSKLGYIEKLPKINFDEYGFPKIVIPYIVLQELDKLKCSKNEDLSNKAKIAIHFINQKLKEKHKQFCGQSAMDDKEKLIPIDAKDDDIVNCILQVKAKTTAHVILFSDDKNLRNKTMVNGVDSFSYNEIKAIPQDASDSQKVDKS